MKLKEIFGSDQNAPLVELKNLLQSNCKRNAKRMVDETAPLLWRGYEIDWKQDVKTVHLQNSFFKRILNPFDAIGYFKSEKRRKARISRTGNNLLMRYIDLSKQWSQFPKRSRSTICSTDLRHAGSFGKAFLIIPFDNVSSFGIAPKDINLIPVTNTTQFGDVATRITGVMRLFKKIAFDAVRYGNLLRAHQIYPAIQTEHEILEKSPVVWANLDFNNINQLEEFCDALDVVLAKLISAKHEQKYDVNAPTVLPANIRMEIQNWEDNDVFDTTKKIYPQLQRIFSPETLGAATTTSTTGINGQSREVWFYGDSLMIGLYAQDFKSDQDGKQKAIDILKELLE